MRIALPGLAFALVVSGAGLASGAQEVPASPSEASAPSERRDAPTFASDAELAPGEVESALPGEIVVDVRDDASAADVADLARTFGLTLTPNSPWSDANGKLEDAHVDPAQEADLLARLAADPRVEHAEPMSVLRASFVPNDPYYAEKQWHLQRVGSARAWDMACGRGVTVAVIDTGVACWDQGPFTRGTDLAGTRCEGGYDFVNDRAEASDDHGHGTHVAGTIAQTTNNGKGVAGLAYCARLMPIKVLTRQGWGSVADVAEGIRFAADGGAQVINSSLGGPIKSAILESAVAHAMSKGVVIVAAAGNSGGRVGYPAAYEGVVAVSATDANDKLAWFSSRGPELAIAAPGVGVTQQTVCDGGKNKCELFGTFSGTSMAAPHVAGAAALLVSTGVTEPHAVVAALEAGARAKDDPKQYGAGILDAGASLASAFTHRLVVRLAALVFLFGLVARRIAKRGGDVARTPSALAGAMFGATGLLPVLPWISLTRFGVWGELVARPFGEWDLALGASLHRWLPVAGALPVVAVAAVLFGVRRLRPLVGGFAVGTAALATQLALSGDASFALGTTAMRLYMLASVGVCAWVARIALDRGKL